MKTLVLGIGNLLWADEGFGIRCVEEFHRRFETDEDVVVLDGGTQGLYLVDFVRDADRLIVFDAIDYGLEPGQLKCVENDQVPRFMGVKKMSLHQTGFQDVIAAAELLGGAPGEMLLIGVQAEQLDDWGGSLRDSVKAQIEPAVAIAAERLAAWGHRVTPRDSAADRPLLAKGLDLAAYERRDEKEAA